MASCWCLEHLDLIKFCYAVSRLRTLILREVTWGKTFEQRKITQQQADEAAYKHTIRKKIMIKTKQEVDPLTETSRGLEGFLDNLPRSSSVALSRLHRGVVGLVNSELIQVCGSLRSRGFKSSINISATFTGRLEGIIRKNPDYKENFIPEFASAQ